MPVDAGIWQKIHEVVNIPVTLQLQCKSVTNQYSSRVSFREEDTQHDQLQLPRPADTGRQHLQQYDW